ncbi:16604_t:CDS:2 [Dentiscutata erythropus]|uniref:16604_t:CDS:1 n=1 Tax=Dentiscutata erythropus TaxID=1348616 RepID=A0A9N9AX73_9GLOM|nr:16604_t:CDS:2 [Dentiscutata erythropus]
MAQEKRACSLLCNKFISYWFPSVDEDYKDYEQRREPTSTGATISCNDKISNVTDTSVINFVYYDPDISFTDGTSLNMPIGFDFRISANNSFANDSSPAFITYPIIKLVDPNLFNNSNRHADDKLTEVLSEGSNMYALSPYQRQIIWLDRVKYSDLGGSLKRGVLSVAVKSSEHTFNYFGLSTRIQTLNPLNPQVIPSQFTTTFEIYNQSSTLITYKESDKASQFKVLTFFTSLGGANALLVTFYIFLFGKKAPGMLPFLVYPFLCCSGPARFIHDRLIAPKKVKDLENNESVRLYRI